MTEFPCFEHFVERAAAVPKAAWAHAERLFRHAVQPPVRDGAHPSRPGALTDVWRAMLSCFGLATDRADDARFGHAPRVLDVGMGEVATVRGGEMTLRTGGLMDCCAVAFLTDFDEASGRFRERSLMHLAGSDLRLPVKDEHGGMTSGASRLDELVAQRRGERHRLVMAFGVLSSSAYARAAFKDVEVDGRQPVKEALLVQGVEPVVQINGPSVVVRPDGTLQSAPDAPQ